MRWHRKPYYTRTLGTERRAKHHDTNVDDYVSPVKVTKVTPEKMDEIWKKLGHKGPVEHL